MTNKRQTKSKPCVFLGYSLIQNADFCFDPYKAKLFTSRHIEFVENVFPNSNSSQDQHTIHTSPIPNTKKTTSNSITTKFNYFIPIVTKPKSNPN